MRSVHILAGLIGIASGAIALASSKGAKLHRRSGAVFVSSMLVMSSLAAILAALKQPHPGNIVVAILTCYLVGTAFLTVRRPGPHARWLDVTTTLGAVTLAAACFGLGWFLEIDPQTPGGVPPRAFYFVVGALAAWLAAQDIRMIGVGGLQGAPRLKRHLGRIGAAMFLATGSLFLGQPQLFAGGPLAPPALRAIPIGMVVIVTLYWLVRLSRPGTRRAHVPPS